MHSRTQSTGWSGSAAASAAVRAAVLVACGRAAFAGAPANDIVFPDDAGIHDVKKEFGARGDGVTDDTAAIQRAFRKYSNAMHMSTVYFPNGIYLVSDQVWFQHWMFCQGESRDKTVIRLKDNCPGYQDPSKPKAVVGTTNPAPSTNCRNMEFSVHFMDFTVETGSGNPGANGIEFLSNNGGGLERVTVRSLDGSGVYGVDITRLGNGPSFIKDLRVEGFDYALGFSGNAFVSTLEDIHISGQRVAGIVNTDHPVAMRRLFSNNKVPALVCRELVPPRKNGQEARGGHFVLIDSELTGGSGRNCAVELEDGGLFLRDVKTSGYRAALRDHGRIIGRKDVEEFASPKASTAFSGATSSLGLPIKESPQIPWDPPSEWVSVRRYTDLVANGDWAPAVQAAIDSGAKTIYFPHGSYEIRQTIRVRGGVRTIQGVGSILQAKGEGFVNGAVIRVEPGAEPVVFLDRLSFPGAPAGGVYIEDASKRALVIKHSRWGSYRSTADCGELFVDDLCAGPWHFNHPQKVWIRSLNIEGHYTKVLNKAADLWVLSYKTEALGTNVHNAGPLARTEILGGFHFPAVWPPEGPKYDNPLYLIEGGAMFVAQSIEWSNRMLVKERRGGRTKTIECKPGSSRYLHFAGGARDGRVASTTD